MVDSKLKWIINMLIYENKFSNTITYTVEYFHFDMQIVLTMRNTKKS